MGTALTLGRRGDPSPNPHVGCVIADGSRVIAESFHQAAGMDHAEIAALGAAGKSARGKALYVTLEPCNHEGRTPPCVDAIIRAGIARVVVGCRDPNPSVRGGGIERLQQAGVEVTVGVREREAQDLIRPWQKFITQHSSYLTLKLAMSVDGRIASRSGDSKWITGEAARRVVHELRAKHDGVLVGINTVLSDDPLLTVREIEGSSPVRVVVDSTLRLPLSSQLVETAGEYPTCVVTTQAAPISAIEALESRNVSVIRVPATPQDRCDMRVLLRELAAREVVSVLCEGGAELAGSLLANRLADELHAFIAPMLLGPRGRPGAVDWAGPEMLSDAPRIEAPSWTTCGEDLYLSGMLTYPEKPPPSST